MIRKTGLRRLQKHYKNRKTNTDVINSNKDRKIVICIQYMPLPPKKRKADSVGELRCFVLILDRVFWVDSYSEVHYTSIGLLYAWLFSVNWFSKYVQRFWTIWVSICIVTAIYVMQFLLAHHVLYTDIHCMSWKWYVVFLLRLIRHGALLYLLPKQNDLPPLGQLTWWYELVFCCIFNVFEHYFSICAAREATD